MLYHILFLFVPSILFLIILCCMIIKNKDLILYSNRMIEIILITFLLAFLVSIRIINSLLVINFDNIWYYSCFNLVYIYYFLVILLIKRKEIFMLIKICSLLFSIFLFANVIIANELMVRFLAPIIYRNFSDKRFANFIFLFLNLDVILLVVFVFEIIWRSLFKC